MSSGSQTAAALTAIEPVELTFNAPRRCADAKSSVLRASRTTAPASIALRSFAAVRGCAATRTALDRAGVLVRLSMWASAMSSAVAIGATS